VTCPACGDSGVWRSHRRNALERLISLAGLYPFRCERCHCRFFRRSRGEVEDEAAPAAAPVTERRRHERIAARVLIGIKWGDAEHPGTTTDVSAGGVGVESAAGIPEDTVLQLTFEPGEDGTTVGVDRAIVRSSGGGRLGLEFQPLDEADRRRIAELVAQILRASPRA
jgi:hypothetical protein